MKANKITKKINLSVEDSIRFQLMTELIFFKGVTVTESELKILGLLVMTGEIELGFFCNETAKIIYKIDKMEDFAVKSQNVRNIVNKLYKKEIIEKVKNSKGKKWIRFTSNIPIKHKGNVLLEYNFLSLNEDA